MWKKLLLFCCAVILCCLFTPQIDAQQTRSGESYYGNGIHQFNRGQYFDSIQSMNEAIARASNDPRPYIFRGLAQMYTGNTTAAEADFFQGAMIEARTKRRSRALNRSLERVQGGIRMQIEKARKDARFVVNNPAPIAPVVDSGFTLPQGKVMEWPATVVPTPSPVVQTQGVEIIEPGQEITPRPNSINAGSQGTPATPTLVAPTTKPAMAPTPELTRPVPDDIAVEIEESRQGILDAMKKSEMVETPFPQGNSAVAPTKNEGLSAANAETGSGAPAMSKTDELIPPSTLEASDMAGMKKSLEQPTTEELIEDPFAIETPGKTAAMEKSAIDGAEKMDGAKKMADPPASELPSDPFASESQPVESKGNVVEPMEKPPTDDPFADSPASEKPMKEAMEEKDIDDPFGADTTAEQPMKKDMEEKPVDDPFADSPAEKPMEEKPMEKTSDDPFADTPPAEQPMEEKPMEKPADDPFADTPQAEQPMEEKPVEETNDDPFADTPPAEQPMEEKPVEEAPMEEKPESTDDDPFADQDEVEEGVDDPFADEPSELPEEPAEEPAEESDPDDPFG